MCQPFLFRWDGQYDNEKTDETFRYVEWNALLEEVRNLSNSRHCNYDGRYHAGGRHIVRRLIFSDRDEIWLARVPIISTSEYYDLGANSGWWTAERKFVMESEIATMKYITTATSLPIPAVFGYQTSVDSNPVKVPYLLMQCIKGNMLYDLGGPGILSQEQKEKVRMSIATIQVSVNKSF